VHGCPAGSGSSGPATVSINQFTGQKVAIIGVHTPETPWERNAANE
jgi:hypothetical protein